MNWTGCILNICIYLRERENEQLKKKGHEFERREVNENDWREERE